MKNTLALHNHEEKEIKKKEKFISTFILSFALFAALNVCITFLDLSRHNIKLPKELENNKSKIKDSK